MKALDNLKKDIDECDKALKLNIEFLFLKVADLYKNYSKMDLNEITTTIEAMYEEVNEIEKETAILKKMENYYELFKQEQDNATDDFK